MPRHLCLILVVWLLTAAGGPGAEPGEDDAAKDLAKLQGKWKLVAEELNGKVTKCDDGHVIGFEKDIEIDYDADGGVAAKATIKLDTSKSPKEIDMTVTFIAIFPKEKGKTIQGIYRLEGDELTLAFPCAPFRQRPKEFTTKKELEPRFVVMTYKRVKP
ncbi:MAG TPA: TIGR03067 domain-containing protein [Gemmataceae bacterium]|nr:TIGR03067 domain-containing protein [Gemmataceae bacterium]